MSRIEAKARRQAAREKYKPNPIRCFLIAEAPPTDDRYFYFENVPTADWLFRGVMKVLFPLEFARYVRRPEQKRNLLGRLQEKGFWLLDAVEEPLDGAPKGGPRRVRYVLENSNLLRRLEDLVAGGYMSQRTPIVLIKATVYDAFYLPLGREGYQVMDRKIPFPSSGQQICFEKLFGEAIGLP
ncbi:MAG: hypothetical protein HYS09_08845 [Chloroflexi bacterium]|nr:hypothetical protein [Chloroflexota bacterium]